jgi:type II secretory pathway pseudopilin PulG
MTTKPPLQNILQGILHIEDESKQNPNRMGSIRHSRRQSESSIDLAAYNQVLKQQKQLNGWNHQIPISINTECQWTQLPHQKIPFGSLD